MTTKRKKAGRPPLGPLAKTFPVDVRIPQWLGKSLLKQARTAGVSFPELVRDALLRDHKRRERKARKGVD